MSGALPWAMGAGLLVHAIATIAVVVRLARAGAWWRAGVALFVPPLAGYWAFRRRMRIEAVAWAAGLSVYALGVAIA